jgi:hypothetical protein
LPTHNLSLHDGQGDNYEGFLCTEDIQSEIDLLRSFCTWPPCVCRCSEKASRFQKRCLNRVGTHLSILLIIGQQIAHQIVASLRFKTIIFDNMGQQLLEEKPEMSSLHLQDKEITEDSSVGSAQSSPKTSRLKAVKFGSLRIREHNVVLGDHPCCSAGCPLELGWEHESETELPVDDYETSRPERRSKKELRTTWLERRELLSQYTDGDLRRSNRKLQRTRRCKDELSTFFLQAAV